VAKGNRSKLVPKNIIAENVKPFVSQRCPIVVYHFPGAHWRLALALMAEMQAGGCSEVQKMVMFIGRRCTVW
jgi:hypothetical protein